MRREHGRDAEGSVDVGQGVRVDHDRHAVGTGLGQHGRHVGAAAGADGPRLYPAGLGDHVGMRRDHRVARAGDVPDHPAEPGRRPGHAQHAGARVGDRAGADADHAAGVLLGLRVGSREQRRHVVGLQALDVGLGEVQPDVDEVDGPGVLGCGVGQQRDLVGAEGDGEGSPYGRSVQLAGVDVDPGRYVDRDDRYAGERLERRLRLGPQPGSSADADDAVHHQVGCLSRRLGDSAPARPLERRESGLVWVLGQ